MNLQSHEKVEFREDRLIWYQILVPILVVKFLKKSNYINQHVREEERDLLSMKKKEERDIEVVCI